MKRAYLLEGLTVTPPIAKDVEYALGDFTVTASEHGDYPHLGAPLDPGKTIKYVITGNFTKAGDKELRFRIDKNHFYQTGNFENDEKISSVHIYETAALRDDFSIKSYSAIPLSVIAKISWADVKSAGKLSTHCPAVQYFSPVLSNT
jgi:hypothetical protein